MPKARLFLNPMKTKKEIRTKLSELLEDIQTNPAFATEQRLKARTLAWVLNVLNPKEEL